METEGYDVTQLRSCPFSGTATKDTVWGFCVCPNPMLSPGESDYKIHWTRYKYSQFCLKCRFCSTLPWQPALSFQSIHFHFCWSLCASAWCWLVSVKRQSFSYGKSRGKNQNFFFFLIQIPLGVTGLLLNLWDTMGSMGWIFHGNINRVSLAVLWSWLFMHFSSKFSCLLGIRDLPQFRHGKLRQGFTLNAKLHDHAYSYNSCFECSLKFNWFT